MQPPVELKLKQASVVLGVDPKDLQNLVQFKVLRPVRRDSSYWFDDRALLAAKVAFYLKDSLGTSASLLARITGAFSESLSRGELNRSRYVWIRSRPATGQEPVEIRIPLANLARELEEKLPRAGINRDLPLGRKRPGWKREFAKSLEAAGRDLSGVTESQIASAIRAHRAEKKQSPEITVGRLQRSD